VQAKFQTIQSAHEILTDKEQRAKYDAGRTRGSGFGGFSTASRPTSGFARGNPWADAGSNFAPPPSRTAPRNRNPPPSAGAQKYASFASGSRPPSTGRPEEDDGPEVRRKRYEAWERMKGHSKPPPTPEREQRSRPPPPPPPQAARPPPIPKRNGFMPSNPAGDEPAASRTSSYNTQRPRAPTAKQPEPSYFPQPSVHTETHTDPLRRFRGEATTPLEPRLRTPYAGSGGERFNPNESVPLNRASSGRVPTPGSRADEAAFGNSTRHRPRSTSPSSSRSSTNKGYNNSNFSESNRAGSETNIHAFGQSSRKTTRPSNLGNTPRKPIPVDTDTSSDESDVTRRFATPKTRRKPTSSSTSNGLPREYPAPVSLSRPCR
jgi:curved DNA-binding protein CbpA